MEKKAPRQGCAKAVRGPRGGRPRVTGGCGMWKRRLERQAGGWMVEDWI